ncbi:MAG: hypothetical protein Q9162_005865 [Coniocarpon cinnabarinum]
MAVPRANAHPTHLPTPPSQISPRHSKRKRSLDTQSSKISPYAAKRQRIESTHPEPYTVREDRLSYWVETNAWPQSHEEPLEMPNLPEKRDASSSRSSSTHWSDRYRELAENGIHAEEPPFLQPKSRDFCEELLEQRFPTVCYTSIPRDKLQDMIVRVQYLNETRLQRDITPWVAPSPEILRLWGEVGLDGLGEELNTEWSRCQTMGGTRPKPDLTVGLMPSAFSQDELKTLQNYASPYYPCYVTPNLCFPFLTCEAKSSQVGLDKADGQNLHSAAISVRAIFQLYERAYGWQSSEMLQDLDSHTLAFSISHDAHRIHLYSHYAVCGEATSVSELHYYRYSVGLLDLKMRGGRDCLVAYNIVRNVYERFAPQHLSRIRGAVAALARSRSPSLVPSEASELGAEDVDSQNQLDANSSEDDRGRKHVRRQHSSAAMATMRTQMSQLMEQLTQQRDEIAQQREDNTKQLAQQREESTRQLAQQREESTKQTSQLMEQLTRQREDSAKQREDSAKQLAHLQQIIDVLCKKQA